MNTNKKTFLALSAIVLLCLVVVNAMNLYSLEQTKDACTKNNKTATVEKDFLAINWSVHCE